MFLSLVAAYAIQSAGLKTEVIFSEIANLTYQLDVVAGIYMRVDPRDFEALWKREFLKNEEDAIQIKRWADVRKKYFVSADLPSLQMQFIPAQSSISLDESIRIAGLQAKSLNDYAFGLNLLVLPADSNTYLGVVRHFQPRFKSWWQSNAVAQGQPFARSMQKHLDDSKIIGQVERFRRFYGSKLPNGYTVPFSLIYRPMLVSAPSSGAQLGNMSVVEFRSGEKPESQLDVILHEFCHFLYGTRSQEDDQALQLRFANTKDPASRPCYNLLNEGMATALGNGVIGRILRSPEAWNKYLATDRSFYNDPYIDRAGKRLLKMMDDWLPKGKTLGDADFVPTFIAAMKQEFGDEITAPRLYLNEATIFVHSGLGRNFANKIRKDLRISSASTRIDSAPNRQALQDFRDMPNTSAIFVVEPSHLKDLVDNDVVTAQHIDLIQSALKTQKSLLFVAPHGPMAFTFLIVADSEEEATRRLAQVAQSKKLSLGVVP